MWLPEGYVAVDASTGPLGVPENLPLFVLKNAVPYPRVPLVANVTLPTNMALVEAMLSRVGWPVGLLSKVALPSESPRAGVKLLGCVARLLAVAEARDGFRALFRGGPLFELKGLVANHDGMLVGRAAPYPEPDAPRPDVAKEALDALREVADAMLSAELGERTAARNWVDAMKDARDVASACLHRLPLELDEKQQLLAAGPNARLERALRILVTGDEAERARANVLEHIRAMPGYPR